MTLHHLLQPLRPLAQGGDLGPAPGGGLAGLGRRDRVDRLLLHPCPPARC